MIVGVLRSDINAVFTGPVTPPKQIAGNDAVAQGCDCGLCVANGRLETGLDGRPADGKDAAGDADRYVGLA